MAMGYAGDAQEVGMTAWQARVHVDTTESGCALLIRRQHTPLLTGYVPAKLPPSALTPLQSALFAVSSPASLEIIEKLVYNAVVSPQEPKFKKACLCGWEGRRGRAAQGRGKGGFGTGC